MSIDAGIDRKQLGVLLELARQEDLGDDGDLTTLLLPELSRKSTGTWKLVAREEGRFCGAAILPTVLEILSPEIHVYQETPDADGAVIEKGQAVVRFSGPTDQMLAAERILLNLLQHLSGVATMTARYVAAIEGASAKIYDTRKTLPGLRRLDKYAVRCGGGFNHRIGLSDAVLIKDNHLAGIPTNRLAHSLMEMLSGLNALPTRPKFIEVECDHLEQMSALLKVVGIDVILLDNFDLRVLAEAVKMRDAAGLLGKVELEASGCVTLRTVGPIARTGVDRIAVGAITHSAPFLDIGLDAVSCQ